MKRWTHHKAKNWYRSRGWLVGINFIPSTAVNQLEMWQKETFDPETIDRELEYAHKLGFNTARVFLHNLLWEEDPRGLINRMEKYLDLASGHNVKTVFVIMDGCWNPKPKSGKQGRPLPYTHNSRWVQSPGSEYLKNKNKYPLLKSYVKGIIESFGQDKRILMWDLFNEPNNPNSLPFVLKDPRNKESLAHDLLEKTFAWAREANPDQPLTAGVWGHLFQNINWSSKISQLMLTESDIITFHSYRQPKKLEREIAYLKKFNRPIICTEFMARPLSTFEKCLPVFKRHNVGCLSWGLVSGKTQTIFPWSSWIFKKRVEPKIWFHDILRKNGMPFDTEETGFIKKIIKQ